MGNTLGSLGECEYDCNTSTDCISGLFRCTQDTPKEILQYYGLDERKAYCKKPNGPKNEHVCYSMIPVLGDSNKHWDCEGDCKKDTDCHLGYLCAAKHKDELKAFGFDPKKANCGKVGGKKVNLCFDPTIIDIPFPDIEGIPFPDAWKF